MKPAARARKRVRGGARAVGVKIYKSIGMELKSKKTGKYLMPDNPVFDVRRRLASPSMHLSISCVFGGGFHLRITGTGEGNE
jgi:hypothetical protein